ncbi:MAG: response regulator transcription factor [Flavobacteriales bacterium]|jgi:DNA-binding response OmpR family regulator|nr:response regulator transcription factor [Flavobacteriales bacterium]
MAQQTAILLVEDDPNLGNLLAEYLRAKDYAVTLATDGKAGWDAYRRGDFDLLVLDVMMPVKDGFTLAQEIRAQDSAVPIVFLTARSMKQDTLNGLGIGADDYITKPFSMEELLLRIGAVLRRTRGAEPRAEEPDRYDIGGSTFEPKRQLLRTPAGERRLTTKESELLRLLCAHEGQVLERSVALNEVWGSDSYFSGRSMDVYIAKLRKYLREDPALEIINVHGKGFRLVVHA